METVKRFWSKELFAVDGFHLTIGLLVILVLIYIVFFKR